MLLLSPPLTAARIRDSRCSRLRNQQALKRLRTSKTEGWSMMGADAVDGIAGGKMTLRDDSGKGPRRMGSRPSGGHWQYAVL